jgi:asparagine synthase (glutamine-hydrolysing)
MTASPAANLRGPELGVSFAGIQLKNPVLAASGTFGYGEEFARFVDLKRGELYRDDFLAQLTTDPAAFLRSAWQRCQGRDTVTCASLGDLTTYLPCDLMTKVDIASMAHGLECRAPLLDYRLVEFAAALPVKFKYRRGRGKWLLREAFGHLLPREVFTRHKMGFGVPLDSWFRNELKPLAADLLLSNSALCRTYFRPEAIQALWDAHQQRLYDHSARLWALLMLEAWLREWSGTPSQIQVSSSKLQIGNFAPQLEA